MVREWSLNLENMGGKKGLKDPLGFKQDTDAVMVRQSRDNTRQTQVEAYERVSETGDKRAQYPPNTLFHLFTESMGVRKVTAESGANVPLHHVDDRQLTLHLHDHVHRLVRD